MSLIQSPKRFGARPLYPFGAEAPPFQRWAARAEAVFTSPLGILIHPQFGLWHAYRAALLFAQNVDLPPRSDASNPCESCMEKPCLSACPVNAFNSQGYDLGACADHIARPSSDCALTGCHARNACPVGPEWRYHPAQLQFHMAAFARSVGRHDTSGASDSTRARLLRRFGSAPRCTPRQRPRRLWRRTRRYRTVPPPRRGPTAVRRR